MKNFVLMFIKFRYLIQKYFGMNLSGLGKIQLLLRKNFEFKAFGKIFYYINSIEASYDYLLIGKSNEPETHLFLNKVIPSLKVVNFIDVGASIGEFVYAITNYSNVNSIFAFEPRPDCAMALRINKELNKEQRITIFENAVSDTEGTISIFLNAGGSSSGIYSQSTTASTNEIKVNTVLLDDVLPAKLDNTILLIDVEGAEPMVIRGGMEFIKRNNPLIIFEYNEVSKKYFNLIDIQNILGESYLIYCIKSDGSLDQDFSNSWNCAAIPVNTDFETILLK